MAVQMQVNDVPNKETRHAREIDWLNEQCNRCKLKKPNTPTKDCQVRVKMIVEDSELYWKKKHLFMDRHRCKMFKEAR